MSTYTNWSIKGRDDLVQWILRKLGAPLIEVELTSDQIEMAIDDAVEEFGRYYNFDTNYFGTGLENYESYEGEVETLSGQVAAAKYDEGITLPDNVNAVVNIHETLAGMNGGMNDLMSSQNVMLNMGMFPDFHSIHKSGGWINYHLAMQSVELTKKMMGGGFQFDYNSVTHKLKLNPDPSKNGTKGFIVAECQTLRPEDQTYGESVVKRLALAEAMIVLGRIRSKFQLSLVGGGTLDTGILDEGQSLKAEVVEELKSEQNTFNFFMG